MHLRSPRPNDEVVLAQPGMSTNLTPGQKMSRSDVHFPLTTPRKRNPSIPLTHAVTEDGQSSGVSSFRRSSRTSSDLPQIANISLRYGAGEGDEQQTWQPESGQESRHVNFSDLPEEIQKRTLDYIFGDLRPVNAASTLTSLSHRMRHPRRKAVSELALISPDMRVMVQERIYRHIKIKGTRDGLRDATSWFRDHAHLAQYVRHIEYWVPVWGDKAAALTHLTQAQQPHQHHNHNALLPHANEFEFDTTFPATVNFKLSTYSATLSDIFAHLHAHFPSASIFTLEGGHCKNSAQIKHFKPNLFAKQMQNSQQLTVLPNIKVFAMRGAWNIMRSFDDWERIERSLPGLREWHCGYAKPRLEAYLIINEILLQLPWNLRHVDVCLDSMFSKDDGILGSSTSLDHKHRTADHTCEQLGRIAPRLESLSFTGKICECFFTAAIDALTRPTNTKGTNTLQSLDIVVKSCCRQLVTTHDPLTNTTLTEEVGGIMADGAGITNLVFINSFERLVMAAVDALNVLIGLQRVKIRYIDLDSPCQQLNPYWSVEGPTVTGIWNDRIIERLSEVRPDLHYERLEDGIGGDECVGSLKRSDDVFESADPPSRYPRGHVTGYATPGYGAGGMDRSGTTAATGAASALYPRTIPRSINTASYKVIAEARAA